MDILTYRHSYLSCMYCAKCVQYSVQGLMVE